jgi:hypothetical protein
VGRLAVIAPLLFVVATGEPVRAADNPGDTWLTWVRGEGAGSCPTAGEFEDKVARQLGQPPADLAEQSRSTIRVRIDASPRVLGGGFLWMAEEQIFGPNRTPVGSRRISKTSGTCGPIADALALVTALLLTSPPTATSAPEPEALVDVETASTPGPDPSPVQPSAPPAPAPARASQGWEAKLEVGPSAQVGRLPGWSWGGELRAFVTPPAWPSLFATFADWPDHRADLSSGSASQGADVGLWAAGAGMCQADRHASSRRFGVCVGAQTGRLHAAGVGFNHSFSNDKWVFDLTLALQIEQDLSRHWFLDVGLLTAVPLIRTSIRYSAAGEEQQGFQVWPVTATCHLGIGHTFN